MKGLKTLIRLQDWKVDETRRSLGRLESERAGYISQGKELEREVIREQRLAIENNMTEQYGPYAEGVNVKRGELTEAVIEIDGKIEIIHDELAELFQESKRLEIALQRREDEAAAEILKLEQLELDETGMKMHRRKNAH
jgi:flagellar protein FliJ